MARFEDEDKAQAWLINKAISSSDPLESGVYADFPDDMIVRPDGLLWYLDEYERFRQSGDDQRLWMSTEFQQRLHAASSSGVERVFLSILGPAGSGKSTVRDQLENMLPNGFMRYLVSATTRKPRPNRDEQDGVDYFFWDHITFANSVMAGEMREWIHQPTGFYGTPVESISQALDNSDVKLAVTLAEVVGAKSILDWVRDNYPHLFIMQLCILPDISYAAYLERLKDHSGVTYEEKLLKSGQELVLVPHTTGAFVMNPNEENRGYSAANSIMSLLKTLFRELA